MSGDVEAWLPLEEVALTFVLKAKREVDGYGKAWQELINALPDHNQTMIESIAETNPTLDAIIEELMADGSAHASDAWTSLVNCVFDRAQAIWETG